MIMIQVLHGKPQYIEMEGNLVIVPKPADPTKPDLHDDDKNDEDKQFYINFRAFRENRRHINVRSWDPTREPIGTAIFLTEPAVHRNQTPLCTLIVNLGNTEEGRYGDGNTADLCRKLENLRRMEC